MSELVDEKLWAFVDAMGLWMVANYGFPRMAGRVMGWLMVCDPAEQTAAELAEALGASAGAISGATGMLVRARLVDRLRIRGERADRFRLRPESWDEQAFDQTAMAAIRGVFAMGLDALAGEPEWRRARLDEMDDSHAWWEKRMPALKQEFLEYKKARHKGGNRD